jgi:hypothetical protein
MENKKISKKMTRSYVARKQRSKLTENEKER